MECCKFQSLDKNITQVSYNLLKLLCKYMLRFGRGHVSEYIVGVLSTAIASRAAVSIGI